MNDIENKITKNPQVFWNYVKRLKLTNSYPSIMKYGELSSSNGPEIYNLFSDYFFSYFAQHNSIIPDNYGIIYGDESFCQTTPDIAYIAIDDSEVYRLLKPLDIKSAGPDAIPAIFIIKCAKSLTIPLSLLYAKSIREGVVPSICLQNIDSQKRIKKIK